MRIVHSSAAALGAIDSGGRLELNVLFTSTRATIAATKVAEKLAEDLVARIRIIVPQIVPFPLPLSEPAIDPEFTAQRIRAALAQSAIDAEVQVCLCREKLDAPKSVLKRHSLILIGGRRRLWRTEADRLVRRLRQHGHEVMFIAG
jgi:hypothetical protein